MSSRRISVGVHGDWGSGKTWFAQTAPGPRLVLDTEGGAHDVETHRVPWIPGEQSLADLAEEYGEITEDTSVIVDISTAETIPQVIKYLQMGDHPFESVIFDSLTESQKQLKEQVANPGHEYNPDDSLDYQAWGRMLAHGEKWIRSIRDLSRQGAAKPVNVVVVMGTDDEVQPFKPLLQGALRKNLPGFFDLLGFIHVESDEDGNPIRIMRVTPQPFKMQGRTVRATAKCRLHNIQKTYNGTIASPDMRDILACVNQETSS